MSARGWKLTLCAALAALGLTQAASGFYSDSFYSPSGNIQCRALGDGMGRPVLACTTFNNGRVAYLHRYSVTSLAFDSGQFGFSRGLGPTLAYNRTWSGYGFECYSVVTGMQCENLAGHGFKIAREGISRF
jgi:hypothetical protein